MVVEMEDRGIHVQENDPPIIEGPNMDLTRYTEWPFFL